MVPSIIALITNVNGIINAVSKHNIFALNNEYQNPKFI